MANPSTNSTDNLELLILETKFKLYTTCYMPKNSLKKSLCFHRSAQNIPDCSDMD